MESRSDRGKQGRYDPSMSRRTRRPGAVAAVKASPGRDGEWGKDGGDCHRPSLKDLLKEGGGEEEGVVVLTANPVKGKAEAADQGATGAEQEKVRPPPANGGNLPRQEQKHLPMVRVGGSGADGVKLAGMVTRCVKLLNHLVKTRSSSKKKTAVQFLK